MSKVKPTKQKIRITITAVADFGLDDLDELAVWKEEIMCQGRILDERIEVIDE